MSFHHFDMTRRRVLSSYHILTQRILDRANAISAVVPSNLVVFDNYIRSIYDIANPYMDLLTLFRGNGDSQFKRINLINPEGSLLDFIGGLTFDSAGIKGNGTNAYIDTNFNPSLLVTGQKYQLNDASMGVIVSESNATTNANSVLMGTISGTRNILADRNYNAHKINSTSNLDAAVNMTGLGLKVISRSNSNKTILINKNVSTTKTVASSGILNSNLGILLVFSNNYGIDKVSSAFSGRSIPYDVLQAFRDAENAHMLALGLPQIA